MKALAIKLLIFIFCGILFSILREKSVNSKRNLYLENFNLFFCGVIYEKDSLQQDGGLLRVMVKESNSDLHDVREETNYYFCTLYGNKAELITLNIGDFKLNDSICVNGIEKQISIFRNGEFIESIEIERLMMGGGPLHYQTRWRQKL
jgi:hypothetical protein